MHWKMIHEGGSLKLKSLPMLLSGLLTLSVPASYLSAAEADCGLKAYQQGNHHKAFECLMVSAKKGDIESQYLVSTMYRLELGIEKDEYKAFEWCRQAAEEGFIEAQFQVGLMYLDGEGVTADDNEAIKWIWEAADRGYPQASEVLQFIFSDDFGVGC